MFSKDVFLSSMEIGEFQVGDSVFFSVFVKGGKPQARNLKSPLEEAADKQQEVPKQQEEGEKKYSGVIHNFNAEKRYGFIKGDELYNVFGKDVFLSNQEIRHFAVGQLVSFNVAFNAKGDPQARNLDECV